MGGDSGAGIRGSRRSERRKPDRSRKARREGFHLAVLVTESQAGGEKNGPGTVGIVIQKQDGLRPGMRLANEIHIRRCLAARRQPCCEQREKETSDRSVHGNEQEGRGGNRVAGRRSGQRFLPIGKSRTFSIRGMMGCWAPLVIRGTSRETKEASSRMET
jgi:hypothetical protein